MPKQRCTPLADRFGRIDVLVNHAASFYAGYFEELTPEQFEWQLTVSLIGPMNVTRAVLPVMRKQRAGHIVSISSSAGLAAGFDFVSAYAASKFGLEGWMESLEAAHTCRERFQITTYAVEVRYSDLAGLSKSLIRRDLWSWLAAPDDSLAGNGDLK